jgi:dTDP-4-dehydrorhamnose reductase
VRWPPRPAGPTLAHLSTTQRNRRAEADDLAATYLRSRRPVGPATWYQLDIRDGAAVLDCMRAARPDVVIHTAYDTRDLEAVIVRGTANIIASAKAVGARVLLISTDAVFDGRRGAYREEDIPTPITEYGQAQAAAEREMLAAHGVVVRTSLVYRVYPPDPANRALLHAPIAQGARPRLYTDEYRCPIHVDDLADGLLELAAWLPSRWAQLPAGGVLHVAGPERLDRDSFACRLAPHFGLDPAQFQAAIRSASPLQRPADCSLDTSLARTLLQTRLRSLDEVLQTAI